MLSVMEDMHCLKDGVTRVVNEDETSRTWRTARETNDRLENNEKGKTQ